MVDYSGRQFGRLQVISREDRTTLGRKTCFLFCKCECGTLKWYRYSNLVNKTTNSCGCSQKEGVSKRSKKPLGVAATRAVWNYYLRNAKMREIEWNLTFEEFCSLILKPCHYCGTEYGTTTKMKFGDRLNHNGVDRFYNDVGYNITNCVACCKRCNAAKSNMHPAEFESWIMNVYSNLFEGNL